jgi:hypothetical protein
MIESFPGTEPVLEAFEIRGAPAGLALYAITETQQFIFDSNVAAWAELTVPTYDPGATVVANVKGITYIFIAGSGIYTYDFIGTKKLRLVWISGRLRVSSVPARCSVRGLKT